MAPPASNGEGRVLILNTGSSTLKWVVLDRQTEQVHDRGTTTWSDPHERTADLREVLARVPRPSAIGHRVVHGGARFRAAVAIDKEVRDAIADLADLAPLHNPAAVAGIDAASEVFPGVPQVAAFDTAFHATIPPVAATYPLPWEWVEHWGLRRFGFHGLSVQYATRRVTEHLGFQPARLVVCHLGAGCSITAVASGRSIDTSMGFTPLEGVMMGRRSGSIDPGLLVYLMERQGVTARELDTALNERSGLLGVSAVSADLPPVLAAAESGDPRAQLARDLFVYRLQAGIGAMAAALDGLDALVFTGGIGQNSTVIRTLVASRLSHLGVRLEPSANERATGQTELDISAHDGLTGARVFVLDAREDLAILGEVRRVLGTSVPAGVVGGSPPA